MISDTHPWESHQQSCQGCFFNAKVYIALKQGYVWKSKLIETQRTKKTKTKHVSFFPVAESFGRLRSLTCGWVGNVAKTWQPFTLCLLHCNAQLFFSNMLLRVLLLNPSCCTYNVTVLKYIVWRPHCVISFIHYLNLLSYTRWDPGCTHNIEMSVSLQHRRGNRSTQRKSLKHKENIQAPCTQDVGRNWTPDPGGTRQTC